VIDREKETETERTRKAKERSMNFQPWVLDSCDIGEKIVCKFPQTEEEEQQQEQKSEVRDKRMLVGGEGDGETLLSRRCADRRTNRQTRRQRKVMRILVLGIRV
jgi:hypothetical protein